MGEISTRAAERRSRASDAHPKLVPTSRWRSWAVTAGLWALVSVGAVGGAVALARPPASASPQEALIDPAGGVVPPEVLGMGEWVVRIAVSAADTASVGLDIEDPAERFRTPDARVRVVSATAIAAELVTNDYWAVTVAAEVELAADGLARWFFEVGVIDDPAGPYAATDPALVTAPSVGERRLGVEGTLRPPDLSDPAMATVASFLTDLLSGDAAVGRWTAPDITIGPAVVAGTFSDVRVSRAAIAETSTDTRRVRVEVLATTATEATVALVYEVTLASRGGRWEVIGLTGAPTLSDRRRGSDASPTSIPTTAPTTTSTSTSTTSTTAALAPDDGATNPYLHEEEEL